MASKILTGEARWVEFGKWVAAQRETAGLNQTDAAARAGMVRQQWNRIEKGNSGTRYDTVAKIADVLGVPRDIALERAGFRAMDENHTDPVPMAEIPIAGVVAAGRPIESIVDGETTIEVPSWVLAPHRMNFALWVRGDSMEDDHIIDGDLLVCHEIVDPRSIKLGQRVVVDMDDSGATYKRWERIGKDHVMLHPSSKKHFPKQYPLSRIRKVYSVTGLIRKP